MKYSCIAFISVTMFLFFNSLNAQTKDTVYFDRDWSICEKPVAEYYRVSQLNKDKQVYYKGTALDYYLNGQLEMSGMYDSAGNKSGHFVFYTAEGKKIKEGNFTKDDLTGNWDFYDSNGQLKADFFCNSYRDFIPVLIINKTGDTLLKNGNGKFRFNAVNDLPDIFASADNYIVEGKVLNGKKEGKFTYNGMPEPTAPNSFINFYPENLLKIGVFNHSNMVFGSDKEGDMKVLNFLVNGETSLMKSGALSYGENIKDFYKIIGTVVRSSFSLSTLKNVSYSFPPEENMCNLLSFTAPIKSPDTVRKIKDHIVLTIDTAGYVINSSFAGNITNTEINQINYYLSHLVGLKPMEQEGEKIMTNMTIDVYTYLDTIKIFKDSGYLSCNYVAVNGDNAVTEADIKEDSNYDKVFNSVQIEASFPGGPMEWAHYCERNLNPDVAMENGAPAGSYTVVVSFIVDKQGNISDVYADNDPGYGIAAEAVRAIKNGPKWIPALQYGHNVISRKKQPFTFQISSGK